MLPQKVQFWNQSRLLQIYRFQYLLAMIFLQEVFVKPLQKLKTKSISYTNLNVLFFI